MSKLYYNVKLPMRKTNDVWINDKSKPFAHLPTFCLSFCLRLFFFLWFRLIHVDPFALLLSDRVGWWGWRKHSFFIRLLWFFDSLLLLFLRRISNHNSLFLLLCSLLPPNIPLLLWLAFSELFFGLFLVII